MNNPPTVSVIVIFYNAERFIEEAVESVLAQTFGDWELLLADDGSTDGSSEIAKRYAAARPEKVRYLEHEAHRNRGMSATRNLGVAHARGRYLAFLDADDVWLPQKLEQQVAILDAHPEAALVYGVMRYWHSWTGATGDAARDYSMALGVPAEAVAAPRTLLRLLLESKASSPCPSDILVRREAVEAVGGFEGEAFAGINQLYEDQAFLAKVYLRYPVYVSGQNWFLYRQHSGSCVAAAVRGKRERAVGLYYFDWLGKYMAAQGVADKELWRALAGKRWRYRHPRLTALTGLLRARSERAADFLKKLARRALPATVYVWMKRQMRQHKGWSHFGIGVGLWWQ